MFRERRQSKQSEQFSIARAEIAGVAPSAQKACHSSISPESAICCAALDAAQQLSCVVGSGPSTSPARPQRRHAIERMSLRG